MPLIIADRVKETSVTTGTGALTLAGAPTGFRVFSAVCAVGDTVYYALQGVDGVGQPTGEWECGLGTYSGANTLTRTAVTSSSNAGAAVTLSAGTKQVYISVPAVQAAWPRERLTAARTYYVATTGSDAANGLTAGTPFLTIQKAIDTVASLDINVRNITIQIADGTYSGAVSVAGSFCGTGLVALQGNTTTPSNVVLTHSGNTIQVADAGKLQVTGCKIVSTGASGLRALRNGVLFFGNVDLGACTTAHAIASAGGVVQAISSYSVSDAAQNHVSASSTAVVQISGVTVTISGTPTFSSAFCLAVSGSVVMCMGSTFSGSANGTRYAISGAAVCDTGGAATTFLPGNAVGTTATGGQYA